MQHNIQTLEHYPRTIVRKIIIQTKRCTLIKETTIYCKIIYQVRKHTFCNKGEEFVIHGDPMLRVLDLYNHIALPIYIKDNKEKLKEKR